MNVSALSLRDLEYVVAVDDERHFGRAAQRCNVSQPALSAQIRKLEEALEMPIFERTSRRVIPTASGEAVARQARVVLAEAARLIAVAQEERHGPLAGRLALGAIQTLGPYLFPQVLRGLRETFPRLAFALSEGRTADLLDALRDGRIDAALVSPPIDETGLTLRTLFAEPFVLACPADHPLAAASVIAAEDLAGPELLLLDEGNCLRDQAIEACRAGSHAGRHATSLETLRSMVAAGAGYTLLPRLALGGDDVQSSDPSGLLAYRALPEDRSASRIVALAWRTTDPREATYRALAEHLVVHAPRGTAVQA